VGSKPKTVKFWCPICSFCVRFRQGKDFSDERGLSFYYLKNGFLVFLNISEYLARYSIQMAPSITVRSWQSWKKPVLCMFGLLSTIIRGREWTDQESANHGKIVLTNENNWASIIRGVARTSARRLGHPARAGPFLDFCSLPHLNIWVDFISHFLTGFITCLERVACTNALAGALSLHIQPSLSVIVWITPCSYTCSRDIWFEVCQHRWGAISRLDYWRSETTRHRKTTRRHKFRRIEPHTWRSHTLSRAVSCKRYSIKT